MATSPQSVRAGSAAVALLLASGITGRAWAQASDTPPGAQLDPAAPVVLSGGVLYRNEAGHWEPTLLDGPIARVFDILPGSGDILAGRITPGVGLDARVVRRDGETWVIHPGAVRWVRFDPAGSRVALATVNGRLFVAPRPTIPADYAGWTELPVEGARGFAWFPDGRALAVTTARGLLVRVELATHAVAVLARDADTLSDIAAYAPGVSPGGGSVAYAARGVKGAGVGIAGARGEGARWYAAPEAPVAGPMTWGPGGGLSYPAEWFELGPRQVISDGPVGGKSTVRWNFRPLASLFEGEVVLPKAAAAPAWLKRFRPVPAAPAPIAAVDYSVKYNDPLQGTGSITSYFSHDPQGGDTGTVRYDCQCNGASCRSGHRGTDIGAPMHTPQYAAADGVVDTVITGCTQTSSGSGCESTNLDCGGGFGNYVRLVHNNGMVSYYAHQTATMATTGASIGCGTQLGTVGSTGHSYGCHIHFEIRQANGTRTDPFEGACNNTVTQSLWVVKNTLTVAADCQGGSGTPQTWIGDECDTATDCTYATPVCLTDANGWPGGMCSQKCSKLCPDKAGEPTTFCVNYAGDSTQGRCVPQCPTGSCRTGYQCSAQARFSEPATVKNACVPPSAPSDPCAGKYGDGQCDTGCDNPDPDCAPPPDPCAGKYGNGKCDTGCNNPDPDCAPPPDPCAGKYGNGKCDTGCKNPDPDCAAQDPCKGKYGDGVCDSGCFQTDPDCTPQDPCDGLYNDGICDSGCFSPDPDCAPPGDPCKGRYNDGTCDTGCDQPDPDCSATDPCDGRYGDGVCDQGCGQPDPDCTPGDPCKGRYGDGTCDQGCASPDPDCAAPGDPCDGRYGDGVCDQGCGRPDPDCAGNPDPCRDPAAPGCAGADGGAAAGCEFGGADLYCDPACPGDPDCAETAPDTPPGDPENPPGPSDCDPGNGVCGGLCATPDPDCGSDPPDCRADDHCDGRCGKFDPDCGGSGESSGGGDDGAEGAEGTEGEAEFIDDTAGSGGQDADEPAVACTNLADGACAQGCESVDPDCPAEPNGVGGVGTQPGLQGCGCAAQPAGRKDAGTWLFGFGLFVGAVFRRRLLRAGH